MVLEKIFKVFPILSLWELYVAMATRVPIQSTQKHYACNIDIIILSDVTSYDKISIQYIVNR